MRLVATAEVVTYSAPVVHRSKVAQVVIEKAETLERRLRRAFDMSDGHSLAATGACLTHDPFKELTDTIRPWCFDPDFPRVVQHLASAPLVPLLVKCMRQAPAAVSDPAAARSQPFPASIAAPAVAALGFILGITVTPKHADLCLKMVEQVKICGFNQLLHWELLTEKSTQRKHHGVASA